MIVANPSRRIRAPRVTGDGGRRSHGFTHETNDCVVRAISNARCIPYAEAHEWCKTFCGRKDRGGVSGTEYYLEKASWARKVPLKLTYDSHLVRLWYGTTWRTTRRVVDGPKTIDAFALAYPKGHFIVLVSRHALAICDGVIYDAWAISGLRKLEAVFEVIS